MLLPVIFFLWLFHNQIVLSLTPSTLVALANVQNHKAKAIANALNLHAKTKYNSALRRAGGARSKFGNQRKTRDSSQFQSTQNEEIINPNDDFFITDNLDTMNGRPNPSLFPQNDEDFELDERIGNAQSPPKLSVQQSETRTQPNSGHYDGLPPVEQSGIAWFPNANKLQGNRPFEQGYREANNPDNNNDRVQSPHIIHEIFHGNEMAHDKSSPIKVLTPSVNINVEPSQRIIHSGNDQVFHEIPNSGHFQTITEHSHGHPISSMPAEHTVIQHGTTFPTTTIFDTRPVHHYQHQTDYFEPQNFEDNFNTNFIENYHQNPYLMPHNIHRVFTHEHSPSFTRTEFIKDHRLLGQPNAETCGFVGMPEQERESLETWQMRNNAEDPERRRFADDERLRTFSIPGNDMEPPEYPYFIDPNVPQNKRFLVDYIEKEHSTFNKLVHSVHGFVENLKHKPLDLPNFQNSYQMNDDYERRSHQRGRNGVVEGARDADNNEIDGNENDLFSDVGTLTPAMQEQALEKYFEVEREDFQNNVHVLQQEHQHNLNALLHALHLSPIAPPTTDPLNIFNNFPLLDNTDTARSNNDGNNNNMEASLQHDDVLGNLIHVPANQFYEDFRRTARSLNQTKQHINLDKLIAEEKDIINEIKKHAIHDEELMMIGYIGDSMIKDIEERQNKSRKTKRHISENYYRRLFTDPVAKLNMPKTLDNLGAVVRSTFEHETTPMYHVRNLVGSAKDAMMAAMKIPNQNFITPSSYQVVDATVNHNERVGDVNGLPHTSMLGDGMSKTFQKVGSAFRDSFKSGQTAVNHIGELANHGKKAITTLRFSTPRLIMPPRTAELQPAYLILPRVLDISDENKLLSSTGKSNSDYVKLGEVFDAVGVSHPDADLHFQKIAFIPKTFTQLYVENLDDSDGIVGSTLDSLQDAQNSVGANNLKDFFEIIKIELRHIIREEILAGLGTPGKVAPQVHKPEFTQPQGKTKDIAKVAKVQSNNEEHMDEIVGAINPLMFQRLFDESLNLEDGSSNTQAALFNRPGNEKKSHIKEHTDSENVGTTMFLTGEVLKPFMGQASKKNIKDFFDKYKPNTKIEHKMPKEDYGRIYFDPVDSYETTY